MGSLVMGNLLLGRDAVCFELLMCMDVLMFQDVLSVSICSMSWSCLVVWDHSSLNWFSGSIPYWDIEQAGTGTLNRWCKHRQS